MTGCIEKFADIDTSIRGSVKFGDGSAVRYEEEVQFYLSALLVNTDYFQMFITFQC
jgi:hypothetical protein